MAEQKRQNNAMQSAANDNNDDEEDPFHNIKSFAELPEIEINSSKFGQLVNTNNANGNIPLQKNS